MRFTVSQNWFPQHWFCLWNGPNVRLIDDGPLSSFQGRSSSASSFRASLLQAIDGVMSLTLCPQVVSQAPQHFRSSKKQATCEGCFARQSICSVISLHKMIKSLGTLVKNNTPTQTTHIYKENLTIQPTPILIRFSAQKYNLLLQSQAHTYSY